MKYFLVFAVFLAIIVSGCAISGAFRNTEQELHGDDVREGTGQGYRGLITVQVRLSRGSITEIVITESAEDRFVGGAAMEELIELMVEYDSIDVDVISGATASSKGFLEAVKNAIMNL